MSISDPYISRDVAIERARVHAAACGEDDSQIHGVSLDSFSTLVQRLQADGRLWLMPAVGIEVDDPFWLVTMRGSFSEPPPLLPDGRPAAYMALQGEGVRKPGVMWVLVSGDTGLVAGGGIIPDDAKL